MSWMTKTDKNCILMVFWKGLGMKTSSTFCINNVFVMFECIVEMKWYVWVSLKKCFIGTC